MIGQITKIISNLYYVNVDNKVYACHSRGLFRNNKITPLVGDFCKIDSDNCYILDILPRKNFLNRPLVANVDQCIIMTSLVKPDFDSNLLDKLLVVCEINNIKPIICFSKEDLLNENEKALYKEIASYYKKIGYQVFYNYETEKIKEIFKDKTTFFTGQTGSGKSSMLNRLDSSLNLEVGEISLALGRGKHTTRCVELLSLFEGKLVDTPGFSSIDLSRYSKEEIRDSFIEFGFNCKYKDCNHINEDISLCDVKKRVENKQILRSRYENYINFEKEINNEKNFSINTKQ